MPDTSTADDQLPADRPVPPMTISIVVQMDPLWKFGEIGEVVFGGDLQVFAEGMTAYVAENLERFAGPRGADLFVRVLAKRGEETRGHEYRSGHYVKDQDPEAITRDPTGEESR